MGSQITQWCKEKLFSEPCVSSFIKSRAGEKKKELQVFFARTTAGKTWMLFSFRPTLIFFPTFLVLIISLTLACFLHFFEFTTPALYQAC
jgi:hypothetical protein